MPIYNNNDFSMPVSSSTLSVDMIDLEKYKSLQLQSINPISFKVAAKVALAVYNFKKSIKSYKVNLNIDCDQSIHKVLEFEPRVVDSVTSIVQNRNIEPFQQFGNSDGLARYLHTDLNNGISLDNAELEKRKQVFGANIYTRKRGKSFLGFLLEACNDVTLIILICCALLSLGFGIKTEGIKKGWYDGVSIAFAVLLVVFVTAISNFKQSNQFEKLAKERDNIKVQVIRGGSASYISIHDVVVGDIVELKVGDQIPADGLYLRGYSLAIDESSFTGESEYYYPDPDDQPFLRSGSMVQDGHGFLLITSVGKKTEWGHMMELLTDQTTNEKTPLQVRLGKTTSLIGFIGMSVAGTVLIVLVIFYFVGHSTSGDGNKFKAGQTSSTEIMNELVNILSIAVTIIVVAVPEGLPLAVTLTLAYSMRKMMKDNALVRRLAACETMGSATIICSDKTGTLTTNDMEVTNAWFAGKIQAYEGPNKFVYKIADMPIDVQAMLYQAIAQNTTASISMPTSSSSSAASASTRSPIIDGYNGNRMHSMNKNLNIIGSPTEKAILKWGVCNGMDFDKSRTNSIIVQVETFNSKKKRAGVVVRTTDNKTLVHWKGAAEIILSMCTKWMDVEDNESVERELSEIKKDELSSIIEDMANHSLRCVAFAYCDSSESSMKEENGVSKYELQAANLTLLAIVGMKDPCRYGVKNSIEVVKKAGVKVMMVTGDNLSTAKAIAKECSILGAEHQSNIGMAAVEGATFREWTDEERRANLPNVQIIARALPSDKLLLVETLKSMGQVVAVTGDGTNDAPALHKADIGLSMGIQGTEVAKESSDIIILDDNFSSIVNVVRWGRAVYFNIQKFLQFQLTVNVAALAINFVAAVTSGDVPLTVVQLLWVNLIMDTLGALALATEPPTKKLLERPPVSPKEPLITNVMWRNIIAQAIYQVTILLILQFKGVEILHLSGNLSADVINQTIIFNTFVLCQVFNEFNARHPYRRNIFHGLLRNRIFLVIIGVTLVLQVVMVEFLEKFANTTRLDWQQWLICFGLASISWIIGLITKLIPHYLRNKLGSCDGGVSREVC